MAWLSAVNRLIVSVESVGMGLENVDVLITLVPTLCITILPGVELSWSRAKACVLLVVAHWLGSSATFIRIVDTGKRLTRYGKLKTPPAARVVEPSGSVPMIRPSIPALELAAAKLKPELYTIDSLPVIAEYKTLLIPADGKAVWRFENIALCKSVIW